MKTLNHIVSKLYNRPLLITAQGFVPVHKLIQNHLAVPSVKADLLDDMFPDPPCMTVENGLAIIPIQGTIANYLSQMAKKCGGVDVRDIKADLDLALSDTNVKAIALDINTPGGTVDGVPLVAQYIAEAKKIKPIYAFCNDIMASAGMWLAAGATEIYASPFASTIGSIGVYIAFLDQSLAFQQAGLSWEIFSQGEFKTEGMPGTSLSEPYKAILRDEVIQIYSDFTGFVKANRPISDEDLVVALTYNAEVALKKGLIDGIANSITDMFL